MRHVRVLFWYLSDTVRHVHDGQSTRLPLAAVHRLQVSASVHGEVVGHLQVSGSVHGEVVVHLQVSGSVHEGGGGVSTGEW